MKRIIVQTLVLGCILIGGAITVSANNNEAMIPGLSIMAIGVILYLFGKAD